MDDEAEGVLPECAAAASWGYCRIKGELKGVGHDVARGTIARVLKENGIKPAPDRLSSRPESGCTKRRSSMS